MPHFVTLGAAQLGPIARVDSREAVVRRLIDLLRQGANAGCAVVTFPEMALTTFFPRWFLAGRGGDRQPFSKTEMPGPETRPLFEEAARLGVGFYLGYCELDVSRPAASGASTPAVLVDGTGRIVGKYRKIHILGNRVFDPALPFQHMEPHYFETGDFGFPSLPRLRHASGHVHLQRPPLAGDVPLVGAQRGGASSCSATTRPRNCPTGRTRTSCVCSTTWSVCRRLPTRTGCGSWRPRKSGVEEGVPLLGHSVHHRAERTGGCDHPIAGRRVDHDTGQPGRCPPTTSPSSTWPRTCILICYYSRLQSPGARMTEQRDHPYLPKLKQELVPRGGSTAVTSCARRRLLGLAGNLRLRRRRPAGPSNRRGRSR